MHKKWFTMLELIIVIWIILVLILTFRNVFQNNNKDFLYAETCINKIYGDINNFIFSAITSKWLYIDENLIYPKQYDIIINPDYNINFWYIDQNNQSWIYLTNDLSSPKLEENYCKTPNYEIKFSGDNFEININKEVLHNSSLSTFQISDGNFTKNIDLFLCYADNNCKEIAEFTIDARTQSIQKRFCIQINKEESECLQRDK